MFFLNKFTGVDDCIISKVFEAQCQKEHESIKKIILYKHAMCGIKKETTDENKTKFSQKLKVYKFTPHATKGDYLFGSQLLTTRSKIKGINKVSGATHRHGGHNFKILGDPEPCLCFINKPVGKSEAVSPDQSVRLEEIVSTVKEEY